VLLVPSMGIMWWMSLIPQNSAKEKCVPYSCTSKQKRTQWSEHGKLARETPWNSSPQADEIGNIFVRFSSKISTFTTVRGRFCKCLWRRIFVNIFPQKLIECYVIELFRNNFSFRNKRLILK
jgi:hypothetical protein